MKIKQTLILILALILLNGCVQENISQKLATNFDENINKLDCDKWNNGENPLYMGGRLISIEKVRNTGYERNEFILTFQGKEKQESIVIGTKEENIPYTTGKFYKFDLGRKCRLMLSMASSGLFYDPELNALEEIKE